MDFIRVSERVSQAAVVEVLKELFLAFDELARHHGLEKIKTVGDAYMVAGELPEPRADHAEAVADLGLAMRDQVATTRTAGLGSSAVNGSVIARFRP